VEDEQLACHKAFLAARSPVFVGMLNSDMREKEEESATIKDIHPDVMRAFLKCLYTDRLPDVEVDEMELLVAADKYAVSSLKVRLEQKMALNLKLENVCHTLHLAGTVNAKNMKKAYIQFIVHDDREDVMNTEEGKTYEGVGQTAPFAR